ncbi:MAG: curlin repeat-containing protein [Paludibacter sp.]
MKKIVIFLFLLAFSFYPVLSQNADYIQQIRTSGMADILSFQTQNQGVGNITMTHQFGNWNKSSVNQKSDAGSAFANQAYSIQQGNTNEMTIGQIGSGNLLLGFQLGYVTLELNQEQKTRFGFGLASFAGTAFDNNSALSGTSGDKNKLTITQEGANNNVMAIQQGSGNSISAGQKGFNNYLLLRQNGNKNSVSGYMQENTSESVLFDAVIQEGNGLTLSATDASMSKPNGNTFVQTGENLSLQVDNQITNTMGGIVVNQTGHDMKVVVGQSFFSFPMR